MARKKNDEEIERLTEIVKTQRATIKHLRKELGRKTKREHLYSDLEEKQAEDMLKDIHEEKQLLADKTCPKCRGELDKIDVIKRIIYECSGCGYREVVKK